MPDKPHFVSVLKHHCGCLVRGGRGGRARKENEQLLTCLVEQMQDRSLEDEAVCKAIASGGTGATSQALDPHEEEQVPTSVLQS